MVRLRILPDDQRNPHMTEAAEQLFPPGRRTLRPRWKIASFASARETETHWQNRDLFRIVEDFACDSQPVTQTISAGIIERHTGFMNFSSWCLACNQHTSLRMDL